MGMIKSNELSCVVVVALAMMSVIALPASVEAQAQAFPPAPAPTSDGTTLDQAIACVLMLVALVLTYLLHTLDSPINL